MLESVPAKLRDLAVENESAREVELVGDTA
jgi:hypothetical protein